MRDDELFAMIDAWLREKGTTLKIMMNKAYPTRENNLPKKFNLVANREEINIHELLGKLKDINYYGLRKTIIKEFLK